jgi:thiol-disulfide isomerase/thioredoxin
MSCNRDAAMDFDRLFAQRFNELDSLISSSPSSPTGVAVAASCEPCRTLRMPPGGGGGGQGSAMMQWLCFLLLAVGVMLLLVYVMRKMRRRNNYGSAMVLPSVGGAGGTVATPPRATTGEAKTPLGAGPGGRVKTILDPALIMPGGDAKPQFTMFHAEWCGHCKKLKPLFMEAAEMHPDCDFALVENTVLEKSPQAKSFNIPGFPVIMFFKGKKKLGESVGSMPREKLHEFIAKMKSASR